jgi:hypothetical protein
MVSTNRIPERLLKFSRADSLLCFFGGSCVRGVGTVGNSLNGPICDGETGYLG